MTGKLLRTLRGHRAKVTSVAFSGDGKSMVSGAQDMTAKVWDVATGKLRATFTGHANVINAVAFSPDNKAIATGSFDNAVIIWDINTRKVRLTIVTAIRVLSRRLPFRRMAKRWPAVQTRWQSRQRLPM